MPSDHLFQSGDLTFKTRRLLRSFFPQSPGIDELRFLSAEPVLIGVQSLVCREKRLSSFFDFVCHMTFLTFTRESQQHHPSSLLPRNGGEEYKNNPFSFVIKGECFISLAPLETR